MAEETKITHAQLTILRSIQTAISHTLTDHEILVRACKSGDHTTARAIISTQVDNCSYVAKQLKELRKELTV